MRSNCNNTRWRRKVINFWNDLPPFHNLLKVRRFFVSKKISSQNYIIKMIENIHRPIYMYSNDASPLSTKNLSTEQIDWSKRFVLFFKQTIGQTEFDQVTKRNNFGHFLDVCWFKSNTYTNLPPALRGLKKGLRCYYG